MLASARTQGIQSQTARRDKSKISFPLFLITAIVITWLGFGIRLYNLGGDSLWLDEQLTLQTARLGFPEVITGARDHPPLIYVLTSLVLQRFGETEFTARLVSLFAGTLAIPLIILFGHVLRRSQAGLWAALFLAFSPFHLKYAQEARHYALLMSVSLAAYIFLYLAMSRTRIKYWLGFGILTAINLYTHYGAFLVLGSQIILIVIWMIWQLRKGAYAQFGYPIAAALIVILAYLPWVPNFLNGLGYNVGESTVSDTGGVDSTSQWIREAFYAFGMNYRFLPYAILGLVLLGLLILLLQRDGLTFGLLLCGIALPFIFIQAGTIARGAYARYIIYILPLYLFAAALTPATFFTFLNLRFSRKVSLPAIIVSVLYFISFAWGLVRAEHVFIQDDWRGIVQYLNQNASDGDIVAAFSMKFANGFNTVGSSLPYYLRRESTNKYILLHGNRLKRQGMVDLQDSTGQVWIVLYDYQFDKELLEELGFEPKRFQTHLYVMPNPYSQGTILDQLISVYEQLAPVADKPSPSCMLEKDLALLYAQSGEFGKAERSLSEALASCPGRLTGGFIRYDLQRDVPKIVFEGAVTHYLQENNIDDARRVAGILYRLDPHNAVALEPLTLFDLLDAYKSGEVQVDSEESLEPVSISEFVMPQTGDSGDALLIHPPSSVSFHFAVPEEPVIFSSRVAMDPRSWEWGGDGSTFIISATTADGETIELSNLYVSNDLEDRQWHQIEIPLDQIAGQEVILTLKTEPGPAGDFTGDWAGWESPRILQISP